MYLQLTYIQVPIIIRSPLSQLIVYKRLYILTSLFLCLCLWGLPSVKQIMNINVHLMGFFPSYIMNALWKDYYAMVNIVMISLHS